MSKIIKIYLACFITMLSINVSANIIPKPIKHEVENILKQFPGEVGLYAFVIGKNPHVVAINANKHYPMASTYKIPIMMQVFRDIDAGKLKLKDNIKITQEKVVPYGLIPYMSIPKNLTIQDLLLLMISVSDNTATDLLIDKVHTKRIQHTLDKLHLSNIHVDRKVSTLIDDWDNGDQEQFVKDKRDTTTPKAIGQLLEKIVKNKVATKTSCKKMISLLRHQKINTRMPLYLSNVEVAHKTGSLGYWMNDVGVMKIHGKYVVLAIFTAKKDLSQPTYKSNIVIGKLARKIFDYYSSKI